jgi:aquaporin Z
LPRSCCALCGTVAHRGATLPHHGQLASVVMEAVLTFFLLTVIPATATNHSPVGHNASLAVGGTIALDGLFAAPISGASMNPARSFGPALVDGRLDSYWIYLAGPIAGAVLAVVVAWLLRGGTSADAKDTAQGHA